MRRLALTAVETKFVLLVCGAYVLLLGCGLVVRAFPDPSALWVLFVIVGTGSWIGLPLVAFWVLWKNRPLERFPRIAGLPLFLIWTLLFVPPYQLENLLLGLLLLGFAAGIWYAPEIYRYILWRGGRW